MVVDTFITLATFTGITVIGLAVYWFIDYFVDVKEFVNKLFKF